MNRLVTRWAAPVAAAVTLLVTQVGAPAAVLIRTTRAPAAGANVAIPGCSSQIDPADPLAVAASVAAGVFCGAGPAVRVSSHGRQVLLAWAAVEFPGRRATVTKIAFLDPRAAPVVADAEITRAADPVAHRVVLTLYRNSSGQWTVDDLAVADG